MSETIYNCVKCRKRLVVLAKDSSYSPAFRAICEGCLTPTEKPLSFSDLFGSGFEVNPPKGKKS